jgi:hypothetical protein
LGNFYSPCSDRKMNLLNIEKIDLLSFNIDNMMEIQDLFKYEFFFFIGQTILIFLELELLLETRKSLEFVDFIRAKLFEARIRIFMNQQMHMTSLIKYNE